MLGIILSTLAHVFVEFIYLKHALASDVVLTWHNGCALPAWLKYGLPIVGIIGGYFLGQYWWRVVYIEKRHWRFRSEKK